MTRLANALPPLAAPSLFRSLAPPRQSNAADGHIISCVAMYSEVDGDDSTHNEMNLCFDTSNISYVHMTWFTGEYLHQLQFNPGNGFRADDQFHNYTMAWTNSSMAWGIDGQTVYERGLTGCGSGPALDDYHKASYEYYDESAGYWVDVGFFSDLGEFMAPDQRTCYFEFDTEHIFTKPMTINLITHPTGDFDSAMHGTVEFDRISYTASDSSAITSSEESEWDGFRVSCWTTENDVKIHGCNEKVRYVAKIMWDFEPVVVVYIFVIVLATLFTRILALMQHAAAALAGHVGETVTSETAEARARSIAAGKFDNAPTHGAREASDDDNDDAYGFGGYGGGVARGGAKGGGAKDGDSGYGGKGFTVKGSNSKPEIANALMAMNGFGKADEHYDSAQSKAAARAAQLERWAPAKPYAKWTTVGVGGLLTRVVGDAHPFGVSWCATRRQVLWFGTLAAAAVAVLALDRHAYYKFWTMLSLVDDVTGSVRSELFSEVVLSLALMQLFHCMALCCTPYPKAKAAEEWENDARFVARIGVVIPCHKSEAEVGRTVASILAAGISAAHIIVVDNANDPTPPDNTRDAVARVNPEVRYLYVPKGLKTLALWKGTQALPPSVEYVLHMDDDTVLPERMVFDPAHFDEPRTSAVSYGIMMFRAGAVERLVDFEFTLWSHWRLFRSEYSTAWFCHGIVGLWRRERFESALAQHPFLPFGEDGWLGMITLGQGYRIAQELRSSVLTFAPDRLFPAGLADPFGQVCGTQRTQGYGAASVWKQRSNRWFVNAPRRIPLRILQLLTYDAGSISGDLLFRVEVMRHLVITLAILAYPLFVARVAYDGTWLYLLEIKGMLFCLDIVMYSFINYVLWCHRPDVRAAAYTVVTYPFYRMFLRAAYVVGHWRCVLYYIPDNPMRTAMFTDTAPAGFEGWISLPDWLWQRALYTRQSPRVSGGGCCGDCCGADVGDDEAGRHRGFGGRVFDRRSADDKAIDDKIARGLIPAGAGGAPPSLAPAATIGGVVESYGASSIDDLATRLLA